MSDKELQDRTDEVTLRSCCHLIVSLEHGLPSGETRETVLEFLDVHAKALADMKQRKGKSAALLTIGVLRKRYAANF